VRLSALAVFAVGLGTTAGVTSATAKPLADPGTELTAAMRRDLGLTAEQARTRLAQESTAMRVSAAATAAAGDAFGGTWFDDAAGTLVVGLTDTSKADEVRATGAEVVPVAVSAATLDAAKARIDARTESAPAGVHSWRVDPRSNSVVVTVGADASDAEVRAFVGDAAASGPVAIERTSQPAPRTFAPGTVGGDPYYINGNTRCSIGFSVGGGFVTAGHCGGVGSSTAGWDRSAQGTFAGSSFPGNDYAFVRTGNGWWQAPVVLGWGTVSDVIVRGSNEAPVGSSICRSGSTTHWHCGTVQAKNVTVNYAQGAVYQTTQTSVCAEPGDSGGSYVTGDQAQGVTSGGSGNCSSGGRTFFQPVNEILSVYGLRLTTG
jgi:hypothetical protein